MFSSSDAKPARLEYGPNSFRQLTAGDHVLCAVSGVPIPLDMLRYWDVEKQEPYASAQIATEALYPS
ncbi:DUF2093 domain-containing protein [Croceicoccus sp. YJ47]|uniref:DUF2093 domain-containing protein n=1 Tax=Croceicoccus sp. YJ47 TaxID=2798724 RepID=UPI001922381D|nr:DUF2093 domain-containing protein [Croceicoccus sp. YJ47]QQN74688.1 DUF2093 domain-containing protein [Croceicoccus sp. YJ47]